MRRIFPEHSYGPGPRDGCWWDETCAISPAPRLVGEVQAQVAVIGAGFTGMSAALHLAEAGVDVVVVDAEKVGWGASGRNGGFCCLGGGIASDATLDRAYGRDERRAYRATEKAAIDHVLAQLSRGDAEADLHSHGETQLAHRARDMADLEKVQRAIHENHGVDTVLHDSADLTALGMNAGFHGGLTVPLGVGLNPRKFLAALYRAAVTAGARVFEQSPAEAIDLDKGRYRIATANGRVEAPEVLIATNGYSSESLSFALRNRFMPSQSSVLVTRPLTVVEREAQGWSSEQMCYDTRHLLHYFRLMPDGRFLFGMRGGLMGGAAAETRARHRVLRHFRRMFPAWQDVQVTHSWSGLVALARSGLPFAGACPGYPGLFAALCYHGNGVAMGSYCGALVAQVMLGERPQNYPRPLQGPLRPFPLGRARRLIMPPLYASFGLLDL